MSIENDDFRESQLPQIKDLAIFSLPKWSNFDFGQF